MIENSNSSRPSLEARLDGIENAVWRDVANRRQKARRATVAFAAAAFLAVSAASYGAGAMQGQRAELHFSMTAGLSEGGNLLDEQAG